MGKDKGSRKDVAGRMAFSYRRFSDPKQGRGRSRQRQIQRAERFARRHKLQLDLGLEMFDEGLSGYWGDHAMKGALGKFVDLCGTPRVPVGSVLIIEDFDRLSRQLPDDAWELFRKILLKGVDIVVLSMGKWFTKDSLNSFEDRILVQASQQRAHEESKLKAERLRDVWKARRRRARKGKPVYTQVPGWMVKRGRRRRPELDPTREATVREMVRLHRDGMGVRRIARELAAEAGRWPCWLRSGEWEGRSIYKILTSAAIWGAYQPRRYGKARRRESAGDMVRGHYPAILTEEEAEVIRAKLFVRQQERGRTPGKDRSVLSRLCHDAASGMPLQLRPAGRRPAGGHYVFLDRPVPGGRAVVIAYPVLELHVLRVVQRWTPEALRPPVPAADGGRARALETAIIEIRERRAAIKARMRKVSPGAAAHLVEVIEELEVEEEGTRAALAVLQAAGATSPLLALAECQSLWAEMATTPPEAQGEKRRRLNARLRELLAGVWVYREDLGPRRAAIYVQVWPRVGPCDYAVLLVGKPPAGWEPLDFSGVDLRSMRTGQQPGPSSAQAARTSA